MTWFVYAVLAAFMASLASVIEKRALSRVHSTDFSLIVALFIAICSIPFFFVLPHDTLTAGVLVTIYATSLLASFAFLEVTKGIRHMEISSSAPLFLLSPFLTALVAYIVLGEALTNAQLIGMGLLALGTYILQTKNMRDGSGFLAHFFGDKYSRLILLGLCFYALTSTIDRQILGTWHVPPMLYVGLMHYCIFFNFLLLFVYQKRNLTHIPAVIRDAWRPLVLVALFTLGYRMAYSMAVSISAVALVIAIKRSSSLFTTVIGGQLFHDHAILRKAIACSVMLLGVALMALR